MQKCGVSAPNKTLKRRSIVSPGLSAVDLREFGKHNGGFGKGPRSLRQFGATWSEQNMLSFVRAPFRTIVVGCIDWFRPSRTRCVEKNAGSAFGVAWILLLPVLFLALYSAVYLIVFKVKPADMTPAEYVLFVYIGCCRS